MTYSPYPAGTLLIPCGPGDLKHLFIILTNRCGHGQHLIVSISSIKDNKRHDGTCIFAGGEHSFIRQPSFVYYKLAYRQRAAAIEKYVQNKYFDTREDLVDVHFDRVCDGLLESKFSSGSTQRYFLDNQP